MRKNIVKTITSVASVSALISVCSLVSIPLPVPITLQSFAVFFALFYLGGGLGTVSVIIYIAIGALGLPVFSGFSGGVGHLIGIGGGYISGFLFAALFYRLAERLFKCKSPVLLTIISAICLIIIYALGTVQYVLVSGAHFVSALAVCVAPFIIPDIIKILFAYRFCKILRKRGINI